MEEWCGVRGRRAEGGGGGRAEITCMKGHVQGVLGPAGGPTVCLRPRSVVQSVRKGGEGGRRERGEEDDGGVWTKERERERGGRGRERERERERRGREGGRERERERERLLVWEGRRGKGNN